ncbi:MAG: calcium-translocating P-type ATPase, PMCA-type [Clostridia bacterium]|nr:calcium-translocating P-type ATPase, PMCA-type [Clostridia bacterium]
MTNKIKGLSREEVIKSREKYGDNSLNREKKKSLLARFFENLSDPIIRILLIALALQIVFTLKNINYAEIGGIIVAILLSTLVSTISEYRSEQAFDKLHEDSIDGVARVIREGEVTEINPSEIVVGDIVCLNVGEKIQADGEIISGRISVDQSALNGESVECVKCAGSNRAWELTNEHKAFRGSVITDGAAMMRVERVGVETFYGMVAKDVQSETRISPLKLRLGRLATQISKIGYVAAIIVGLSYLFNAVVVNNGFDTTKISEYLTDAPRMISTLLSAMTLMITMVVVAAPEGLPMMITVVLSANMKRMLNDNILVKKLVGIETAGSMNILFTDKTGTITVGKPECEKVITAHGSYRGIPSLRKTGRIYDYLNICAHYNTDVVDVGGRITGGNPTDRAIYDYFADESVSSVEINAKESFSSERKSSSVTLNNGIILIKGAAERILMNSTRTLNSSGDIISFSLKSVYNEYLDAVNHGQRVVGVAMKSSQVPDGLIFLGLIVMKDKIRHGVKDAVRDVSQAGIQIVMITGDGKETASAIAKECGILNPLAGHIALSADELHSMSDDEVKTILPILRVVSRALPQDKTRLVRLSQELDLVVGMTGDGINDAPSLKLADVGFSMGSGTDIAKSASDIVILDNSFLAILKTILYGRTIFKSIRKFITFQLTMNFVACGVSLIGQFIGIETPITIIQMLWVNIIMDTLGGLAFAGEAPMPYYMKEKPKRRDEEILSREMLNQIFITGAYTLILALAFLSSPTVRIMYGGLNPTDKLYTAFYALFIFLGIFNCLLARSSRLWLMSNISKNRPFIFIMILISVIQVFMIYFGGTVFRCVPLLPQELSFVILLAMTVVPFEMARRLIYKLK